MKTLRALALVASLTTLPLIAAGCCCPIADDLEDASPELPTLPPEPATTAEASRTKAPPWASEGDREAPQPHTIFHLFEKAAKTEVAAAIDRDLLVCRIAVEGRYDVFLAPDLSATLTLGDRPPFTIRGTEDSNDMLASAPLVTLKAGDRVTIAVADRDATGLEHIGEVVGAVEAIPFTLSTDKIQVECRRLDRDGVETELSRANRAAEAALKLVPERFEGHPADSDWGYTRTGIGFVKDEVLGMAAVVGWADTRVGQWIDHIDKLDARWREAATISVKRLREGLPPARTPVVFEAEGVKLTIEGVACGEEALASLRANPAIPGIAAQRVKAARCLARVAVENTGMRPINAFPMINAIGELHSLRFVEPDGSLSPALFVHFESEATEPSSTLDPGQRGVAILVTQGDTILADVDQGARLLSVTGRSGPVFLRVLQRDRNP